MTESGARKNKGKEKPPKTETPPPESPPDRSALGPIGADPTIPDTSAHRTIMEKDEAERKAAKDRKDK